jgi:hypothetical protein
MESIWKGKSLGLNSIVVSKENVGNWYLCSLVYTSVVLRIQLCAESHHKMLNEIQLIQQFMRSIILLRRTWRHEKRFLSEKERKQRKRDAEKVNLDWTSSLPRNLFMIQAIPALVPVITAKLRACIKGPPAKACRWSILFVKH